MNPWAQMNPWAHWVPTVLLNHWVQLASITPVMFYVGWPIYRTDCLAQAHRSADSCQAPQ